MANFYNDVRYALRMMRNSPGFTTVAVLSLALGIGANTAIFSLIDAVLLRMLPVKDPQSIVLLSDPGVAGRSIGIQTGERSLFTYPEFVHLRDHSRSLASLIAVDAQQERENVTIGRQGGEKELASVKLVSGNYFSFFGVTPAMGRFFTPEEDRAPGSGPVAVISHEYWRRRFGLSNSVLGETVRIHRTSFTIIGVGPRGFTGDSVGESPEIWIPATMQREVIPGRDFLVQKAGSAEKVMWLRLAARLRPGFDRKQAKAELNVEFRQFLEAEAGGTMSAEQRRNIADTQIEVYAGARGASSLRRQFSEPLLVLMSVVGLVLLIACANVANLLLARSTARQREIAIRLALGAGRGQLIRQLLVESILLSLAGGAAGVAFAYWAARLLLVMASRNDSAIPLDVVPDLRLLSFAFAVAVLTGLLFGLIPAIRSTHVDVNPALKDNSRGLISAGGAGRSRFSIGKSLVALQVAISLLLLIGAGLFARSLANLTSVKLGYEPEKLLMISLDPTPAGYKSEAAGHLYERILDRLSTIPGVRSASVSQNGLFAGSESGDRITVEGYTSSNPRDLSARFDHVGPAYFQTVGIPVLLGREFGSQDSGKAAPRVCLINETMSKFYFGKSSPIGKHIRDEFPDTQVTFEIVGVVKDAKYQNVREETPRRFYLPFFNPLDGDISFGRLMVRTNADPSGVVSAIRREIASIDGSLSIDTVRTVSDQVNRTLVQDRLIARLSTFFGLLALMLSCIGLYGVMSYAIARRTAELGIRVALGASRGKVIGMVLRESMLMVVIGFVVGLPAAIAASRLVSSRLFGLKPADPATLAGASLILATVALAAALVPALRASRVDAMRALRYE